jgi:diacylglycerol kinase family enzyme
MFHGDSRRVRVIFNPYSGRATFRAVSRHRQRIEAALVQRACAFEWREITPEQGVGKLVEEAVVDRTDLILICGGDGSVAESVPALLNSHIAVGIIPIGTGNLFARMVGIPMGTEEAVDTALSGARRSIDVGRTTSGDCFVLDASIGDLASVFHKVTPKLKDRYGVLSYFVAALRHYRNPALSYSVTIDDGSPIERLAHAVIIGNLGPLMSRPRLPSASFDDGRFEVAVMNVSSITPWRRNPHPFIEWFQGERIHVTCHTRTAVERDGDWIRDDETVDLIAVRGGLLLAAPEAAGRGSVRGGLLRMLIADRLRGPWRIRP